MGRSSLLSPAPTAAEDAVVLLHKDLAQGWAMDSQGWHPGPHPGCLESETVS